MAPTRPSRPNWRAPGGRTSARAEFRSACSTRQPAVAPRLGQPHREFLPRLGDLAFELLEFLADLARKFLSRRGQLAPVFVAQRREKLADRVRRLPSSSSNMA